MLPEFCHRKLLFLVRIIFPLPCDNLRRQSTHGGDHYSRSPTRRASYERYVVSLAVGDQALPYEAGVLQQ